MARPAGKMVWGVCLVFGFLLQRRGRPTALGSEWEPHVAEMQDPSISCLFFLKVLLIFSKGKPESA